MRFYAGRLELDIVWERVPAASAVQAEPLNPGSTCAWRVHVIDPGHAQTYGHSAFSLHVSLPLMSFSAEPSGAEASKNVLFRHRCSHASKADIGGELSARMSLVSLNEP